MLNKKVLLGFVFLLLFSIMCYSMPFIGGFYSTDNYFEKSKFNTLHAVSFYVDQKINDHIKFYTRLTAGFKYFASYEGLNSNLTNFSILPNIDLMFFQFQSRKIEGEITSLNGSKNYNLFSFRIGRTYLTQGSGFFYSMSGDGMDTHFTIKNFSFRFFAITNSLEFSPFFDFADGTSSPVFTRWDKKRYPVLSNFAEDGNVNGFITDIENEDYNFYFDESIEQDDYNDADIQRLNNLRYAAVLAGRVFTGFSIDISQIYFQNFSFHFLANIDLIPNDFVITYPSQFQYVRNTFGGKYTSFYLSYNMNGKIYAGLYYDLEFVYETGYNATYSDTGSKVIINNALINSFAFHTKLSYYFDHVTKPAVHTAFMYAHGDEDVEFVDGAVVNHHNSDGELTQDNNYRSPTSYQVGYVIDPYFSNMMVIGFYNSVKPFAGLKKPIFSRFSIESGVLLILRPIIKGATFISESADYTSEYTTENNKQVKNSKYTDPIRAYIGTEIDISFLWQLFSDLSIKLDTGVFIPNSVIYNQDLVTTGEFVHWKVGLSANFSF